MQTELGPETSVHKGAPTLISIFCRCFLAHLAVEAILLVRQESVVFHPVSQIPSPPAALRAHLSASLPLFPCPSSLLPRSSDRDAGSPSRPREPVSLADDDCAAPYRLRLHIQITPTPGRHPGTAQIRALPDWLHDGEPVAASSTALALLQQPPCCPLALCLFPRSRLDSGPHLFHPPSWPRRRPGKSRLPHSLIATSPTASRSLIFPQPKALLRWRTTRMVKVSKKQSRPRPPPP